MAGREGSAFGAIVWDKKIAAFLSSSRVSTTLVLILRSLISNLMSLSWASTRSILWEMTITPSSIFLSRSSWICSDVLLKRLRWHSEAIKKEMVSEAGIKINVSSIQVIIIGPLQIRLSYHMRKI